MNCNSVQVGRTMNSNTLASGQRTGRSPIVPAETINFIDTFVQHTVQNNKTEELNERCQAVQKRWEAIKAGLERREERLPQIDNKSYSSIETVVDDANVAETTEYSDSSTQTVSPINKDQLIQTSFCETNSGDAEEIQKKLDELQINYDDLIEEFNAAQMKLKTLSTLEEENANLCAARDLHLATIEELRGQLTLLMEKCESEHTSRIAELEEEVSKMKEAGPKRSPRLAAKEPVKYREFFE